MMRRIRQLAAVGVAPGRARVVRTKYVPVACSADGNKHRLRVFRVSLDARHNHTWENGTGNISRPCGSAVRAAENAALLRAGVNAFRIRYRYLDRADGRPVQ